MWAVQCRHRNNRKIHQLYVTSNESNGLRLLIAVYFWAEGRYSVYNTHPTPRFCLHYSAHWACALLAFHNEYCMCFLFDIHAFHIHTATNLIWALGNVNEALIQCGQMRMQTHTHVKHAHIAAGGRDSQQKRVTHTERQAHARTRRGSNRNIQGMDSAYNGKWIGIDMLRIFATCFYYVIPSRAERIRQSRRASEHKRTTACATHLYNS